MTIITYFKHSHFNMYLLICLPPTAQEEKKARHLANHDLMLVTFYKAQAKTDRWRKTDKVGDRVPEEYKSQAPLANPHPVSGRTTKRRKTTGATVAAAPDGFSSFPVRLTQSQVPKAG